LFANIVNEILGGISMYYFFSGVTRKNERSTNEKRRRNRSTMNWRRIQGIRGEGIGGGTIRGELEKRKNRGTMNRRRTNWRRCNNQPAGGVIRG
jgi:hypothetical protein